LSSDSKILDRWAQHFDRLLNNDLDDYEPYTDSIDNVDDPEREFPVPVPTMDVVEQAIMKLKNNKTPEPDLVQSEIIKYAGPEWVKHLYQLMTKILDN
jgi:hypothetical protein